jgi:hypothetical protein
MGWLAHWLNGYLNVVSIVVKQSMLLPHPYIYAYGFDLFSMIFHFVFVYGIFIYFRRGWRFLSFYFVGFLILNFGISIYRRHLNTSKNWQADVNFSGGYLRVEKSGRTLRVLSQDNIPQEKIKPKLNYVTHAFEIDTVLYVSKNKPTGNSVSLQ